MYRSITFVVLAMIGGYASAHQFTPAYPRITPTYVSEVYKAEMELFNKREDISYFEFQAFDKDWESIPFAISGQRRILKLDYLDRKDIVLYFKKEDVDRLTYICSKSKILSGNPDQVTAVSSRICSKAQR